MTWKMHGGFEGMPKWMKSGLAESWEINAEDNSMVFHIREGVYFHDKPPANGREMTAEDVAFSIERQWSTEGSFLKNVYPAPTRVEALDKYTVQVWWDSFFEMTNDVMQIGGLVVIWPYDYFDMFEDAQDWRNSCGTGPFMMADYVKGSSATLTKHPNYWDVDDVGPGMGNQLPYVDGVKLLVIPDSSTREAAMRTGQADQGYPFTWEEAASLRKTNPELGFSSNLYTGYSIFLRLDNPDFPWTDKRVRQALHMSIDYKSITDDYYGGEAAWYQFPTPPNQEYDDLRVEFEDLSPDIQNLFEYDPAEAKQLLADAGYADGFDLKVTCRTPDAELMSIYKAYWEQIGVNMIIDQREPAAFAGIASGKTHENAYFYTNHTALTFNMDSWRYGVWNGCLLEDERLTQAWQDVWDAFLDWDEQCRIFKEQVPYILENAWMIPSPAYNNYAIWQPWVKDYHGEINLGNCDRVDFAKWIWVDQEMKKEMIGR